MARPRQSIRNVTPTIDRYVVVVPAVMAVLIGAGAVLLSLGLLEHFYYALDCTPLTFRLTIAACLVGFAMGPRLLRGAALRLARVARAKIVTERLPQAIAERARNGIDRDLLWIATGVAGLAAGLGALLLPTIVRAAGLVVDWGMGRFLWQEAALTVFEGGMIFATVCVPFALVGFFARCVHQLPTPAGRWDLRGTVWLLYGVGAGLVGVGLLNAFPPSGKLLMRIGVAPLLVAAIIAVLKASPAVRGRRGEFASATDEPDIGERWPTVLRVALAVCVVSALTEGMIWSYVVRAVGMGSYGASVAGGGALFVAVAAGMAVSIRRSGHVQHTIGAMGLHFAASGVAVAAGMAVFNMVVRASYAPFLGSPGCWTLWGVCACVPLCMLGHAIGFGSIAILRRRGYDSDTGSRLLRMFMLSSACAVGLVAVPLLESLGSYATMVAASLSLLATGGVLMIHEPARGTGGNQARLAGVFLAVIAMICFMPPAGSGWLAEAQARRARMAESWWLVWGPPAGAADMARFATVARRTSELPRVESTVADLIEWSQFPRDGHTALITLDDEGWLAPLEVQGRIDFWSLGARPLRQARLPQAVPAGGRSVSHSALRTLRAVRERYDLLVVECRDWPPLLARRVMESRMLQRAIERLTPDGVLVVLLPIGSETLMDIDLDMAERTALCDGVQFTDLRRGRLGGSLRLALLAGREMSSRENAQRWCVGLSTSDVRGWGRQSVSTYAVAEGIAEHGQP